jgi:hypothetical protein
MHSMNHVTEWKPTISRKIFHPGGMAPSEWTCSVRAVRDTPVADYSMPGLNTTRRIAYRPPIAVSPFLLALSVTYFKRILWSCGQLWPYIRKGSWGTHLHWDYNAIGDVAQNSPHDPFTCRQNAILSLLIIHIVPSRQIYVASDNSSLAPSISCLTPSSHLWSYVRAADDVSHAENLQSNHCWCFPHEFKFEDGIQDTPVFGYCCGSQG